MEASLLARPSKLGRRLLRRAAVRPGDERGVDAPLPAAVAQDRRRVRARHSRRPRDRPHGVLFGRLLLGQAYGFVDRGPVYREGERAYGRPNRFGARADAVDRSRGESVDLRLSVVAHEAAAVRRAGDIRLPDDLLRGAVHHRVLARGPARRGVRAFDLAIDFGHHVPPGIAVDDLLLAANKDRSQKTEVSSQEPELRNSKASPVPES